MLSTLSRWAGFLRGPYSVLTAAGLAGVRLTGRSLASVTVPLWLKRQPTAVFCRPGTSDFHTLLQIWDQGEYEVAAEFVERPVRRVVDLGTNIGLSVRYLSELWPEANFLAVEPDPGNLGVARRNLRSLITQGRVDLRQAFVGDRVGFAQVVRDPGAGENQIRIGQIRTSPTEGAAPVETMPRLLEAFGSHDIDFLKCDIEGSERQLLAGGPEWLRRVRSLVVELHEVAPDWLWDVVEKAGLRITKKRVDPVPGYGYNVVWARLERK